MRVLIAPPDLDYLFLQHVEACTLLGEGNEDIAERPHLALQVRQPHAVTFLHQSYALRLHGYIRSYGIRKGHPSHKKRCDCEDVPETYGEVYHAILPLALPD